MPTPPPSTVDNLWAQIEELRVRLLEAEETIEAIRSGGVDALVVEEPGGHRIYTLEGADRPYRLFVEEMQQGAATLHADGTVAWCNRQLADLLETRPETLVGEFLHDFVSPDSRAVYEDLLRQGQTRSGRGEAQLQRRDGGLVPVFLTFNALPADCGAVLGALITDLTTQRHHEQLTAAHAALTASEERITKELAATKKLQQISSRLIQDGDIGQLNHEILGVAMDLMQSNMASMQMVDESQDALRLLAWRGFDPSFGDAFQLVARDAKTPCSLARQAGHRIIVPDVESSEFPAGTPDLERLRQSGIRAVQSTPLFSRSGRMLGMISTHWGRPHQPAERDLRLLDLLARQAADLMERKQAEQSLRESEARARELFAAAEAARISAEAAKLRAEAATRAKDDFLAALSHELRTPLNPALLLATSLVDDAALPLHVRPDVEAIARGIALQVQLIDDLLDLTRITGGKLRLDLQSIDAHTGLCQAIEMVRSEIQERGIAVNLDLSAEHSCIHADAVRMQQIFWNVLKNAVKFTPPGGTITVRTIQPADRNDALVVEVTDTGIGIAPDMLEKIFESFAQEPHDGPHRFGGLGLGLAITRRLVELQHGKIHARSAGRGCGATFRIEMPLASSVCGVSDPVRPLLPSSSPSPCRRILLVEDHEMTRQTLTRLLERRGHTVFPAATAAAARHVATDRACDLVISDLGLPDCDGHTFMARLRDEHGLPGIALSGYGAEEDLRRSRESGFFTHLTKPVNIRALEAAIATAPPVCAAP